MDAQEGTHQFKMTGADRTVPFFSVVMPVYNGQAYLSAAAESVLAQSDPDWELVIVDDHSTDRTPEMLAAFVSRDARVRVLTNSEKLKIAKSLNRGILSARAPWIVRLDADDWFTPTYLKVIRESIEKTRFTSDVCFFSTWITVVDEAGDKVLDVQLPEADIIRKMMTIENFLYHPATSFTKALWEKAGGYPEKDSPIAEDTALWCRFFDLGAVLVMISKFLVNYRIHYVNTTSLNDAKLRPEAGSLDRKTLRQNREWRISLFLKQKMLKLARAEIVLLVSMQKHLSLKNLQYYLLTFLPEAFVHGFMWEFRPRVRHFWKNFRGRTIRV